MLPFHWAATGDITINRRNVTFSEKIETLKKKILQDSDSGGWLGYRMAGLAFGDSLISVHL